MARHIATIVAVALYATTTLSPALGASTSSLPPNMVDTNGTVLATATAGSGGTTYSWTLTGAVSTPSTLYRTGGTWIYDGQQNYPMQYDMGTDTITVVDAPAATTEARRADMVMVDRLGRRWKFDAPNSSVDVAYEMWGMLPDEADPGVDPATTDPQEADEVGHYSADLVSWTIKQDCISSASGKEWRVWGSDSRLSSTYAEPRHRGAVFLQMGWDTDATTGADKRSICSGVMVGTRTVLTAAHCVLDRGGLDQVGAGEIEVCTHGNEAAFAGSASCVAGDDVIVNPDYRQGTMGQINEDFAIVHLQSDLVSSTEIYAVSGENPGVWEDRLSRMVSYPGFQIGQSAGGCASNSPTADQTTPTGNWESGETIGGAQQARQSITSFGRTATKLNFRFDSSKGDSGAGIFYCPEEDCTANGPKVIYSE